MISFMLTCGRWIVVGAGVESGALIQVSTGVAELKACGQVWDTFGNRLTGGSGIEGAQGKKN